MLGEWSDAGARELEKEKGDRRSVMNWKAYFLSRLIANPELRVSLFFHATL